MTTRVDCSRVRLCACVASRRIASRRVHCEITLKIKEKICLLLFLKACQVFVCRSVPFFGVASFGSLVASLATWPCPKLPGAYMHLKAQRVSRPRNIITISYTIVHIYLSGVYIYKYKYIYLAVSRSNVSYLKWQAV